MKVYSGPVFQACSMVNSKGPGRKTIHPKRQNAAQLSSLYKTGDADDRGYESRTRTVWSRCNGASDTPTKTMQSLLFRWLHHQPSERLKDETLSTSAEWMLDHGTKTKCSWRQCREFERAVVGEHEDYSDKLTESTAQYLALRVVHLGPHKCVANQP